MLLDADHLLLRNKPMPAAKRLCVIRRIGIICVHVGAHDLSGIFRNIEPRWESILDLHPSSCLGIDRSPCGTLPINGLAKILDAGLICHECSPAG